MLIQEQKQIRIVISALLSAQHMSCLSESVDGESTQRDADIGTSTLPNDLGNEGEPYNDAPHYYYR